MRSQLRLVLVVALIGAMLALGLTACARGPAPRGQVTLRVALTSNPPTLDIITTTAIVTSDVARHIFESLFAFDAGYRPVPHLVDKWTVSEDGTEYRFVLRHGVKFHNGRELNADDVVASLQRSGRLSSMGKRMFENVASIEAAGSDTVVLRLKKPDASVLIYLSSPWSAIYPKEVVDAYPDKPIDDTSKIIGTGPFKLVEFVPDRHVKMVRFEGYRPRQEAASGQSGRREAGVDTIEFVPVSDAAVRIAGVKTGEYHLGLSIPADEYERLKQERDAKPVVIKPCGWDMMMFNHKSKLMGHKRIRQAFLAALDMEAIMEAAHGPRDLWRLDPGLMFKEQPMWTDEGKEYYNQKNPEKAKRLLQEAGYKGEPVRILTSQQYPFLYKVALGTKEQLEKVGFTIDLQVVDWATLVQRRANPELWEAFTTYVGFASVLDPTLMLFLNPINVGWYENAEIQGLLEQMRVETNPDTRYKLWQQVHRIFWEDAGHVKYGDFFDIHVVRNEVNGYVPGPDLYLWNVALR